jgi:O-acetylhomoserine (thiol)-lyase
MSKEQATPEFGFETRMVHAGHVPDGDSGARAVPIYQSTSYVFNSTKYAADLFDLKEYGHIYTRISNPTVAVFEERMASLEGATGALATASGMAAQLNVFMTLLEAGDEIVASAHLYGGTTTQLSYTLPRVGNTVRFVDPADMQAWEKAITKKTKALFGEVVGNPKGTVLDIASLAALADSHGIPLIIDNTFATPYLCQPIAHGATIVTHSATKFIGGHGNSLGGILLDSGSFDYSNFPTIAGPAPQYHGLRFFDTFENYAFLIKARAATLRDTGAAISPMNAFMLLQGIETLSIRMDRHVENTLRVAQFLEQHSSVDWVSYPGLPSHPSYDLAKKYLPKGPGAVFSFGIKKKASGTVREAGEDFINNLKLFSHLANVGDVRSLVIHPASTTHRQLSDEELKQAGIGPELIRLSIGIETVDDLLWDLDQALSAG